jgi:hypothetical protein
LWTTPSDLAKFVIGIQEAIAGKLDLVIAPSMARQMVTKQGYNAGLGFFVEGAGSDLLFMHDGRNEGFDSILVATAKTGFGIMIMMNANDNSGVLRDILTAVHEEYP